MQYALLESYEPTGKIGHISYGNDTATDYSYDSLSTRLTSIITAGADEILNKAYTYTPAGDIASITDTQSGVTYSYTYDRLHRLVSETNDGPSDNFAQATLVSTYDDSWLPLHAPASITYNWSEHNYTYDANGNLTGASDFSDPYYISFPRSAYNSITYNADNMPVRIENRKDDGAMVSTIAVDFNYDGNGTRAKKALSNGDTTYYIGDHFEVANGEETKYIFAGNQRIAKVTTGNSYFYHKDHLGSSSVITDYPAGATVETTEYLPFGHERDHTGAVVTDYKFTDQEKDTETGLYNYDARMYDPVIALFISADSVVPDLYDPQSLNRYAYCRNNPLKYVDPNGHEPNKAQSATWETARKFISKGKKLQDLRYTSKLTRGKQVGPFGGTKGPRYIYTKKGGWVDLGHFFQAAASLEKEGGLTGYKKIAAKILKPVTYGAAWSKTKESEENQSGETKWSYEDAPSNYFGVKYYLDYHKDDKTMLDNLDKFFNDLGATESEEAPNWKKMQNKPSNKKNFPENKSFTPMYTTKDDKDEN